MAKNRNHRATEAGIAATEETVALAAGEGVVGDALITTAAPAEPTPEAPAATVPTVQAKVVLAEGKRYLESPVLGTVAAAANVLNRAASLHSAVPAALAGISLKAGKPCNVRVPYTLACWERVQALLTANGGQAPASELAAAGTTDFVRYAVRRGWLVNAAAAA